MKLLDYHRANKLKDLIIRCIQPCENPEPLPPITTPSEAGSWSWPDENTVWDDYDYGFNPPEHHAWSRPFEEYIPDMSDPFSMLLETAAEPEPFEEQPSKKPKRKRSHGYGH